MLVLRLHHKDSAKEPVGKHFRKMTKLLRKITLNKFLKSLKSKKTNKKSEKSEKSEKSSKSSSKVEPQGHENGDMQIGTRSQSRTDFVTDPVRTDK